MVKRWWESLRQFLGEVVLELKKTTWPSRREVYGTTLVVIVMVIVCSMFLWGVDLILQPMAQWVYPTR